MTGALRTLGAASGPEAHLPSVRAPLELPETQIDLSKAKLTIDRMIDPRIDIAATMVQLDTMASQIRVALPAGASRAEPGSRPCARFSTMEETASARSSTT